MSQSNRRMDKILLFKIGAIGDLIMTTPLIRALKLQFPKSKIDYLVGSHSAGALAGNVHINEVIAFDETMFFNKNVPRLLKIINNVRKRRYDMIFVLDKSKFVNIMALFFNIPDRIGFDRLGKEGIGLTKKLYFDGSMHEISYYLQLIHLIDKKVDISNTQTELFPSSKENRHIEKIMKIHHLTEEKNFIVIAPGGAKNPGQQISLKLWPKEYFLKLILQTKMPIVLVGDKNDAAIGKFIESQYNMKNINNKQNDNKKQNINGKQNINKKHIINLIGKTSIGESSLIIKRAKVVICNDTGSMHIATTSNNNIIAIFGPTDPKRFGPLSKKSTILWKKQKCCPCNDIFGNFDKCKSNKCMKSITPSDVKNTLRKYKVH